MITAYDMHELATSPDPSKVEPKTQFLSMGTNADKSWAPGPDGKSLLPIPNGPGANLNDSTNWSVFLQNLYNSGLPQGIFTGNIGVLDLMWAHISNIPEPEGRKNIRGAAKTSEVAQEAPSDRPRTVPVISEILPGGEPWAGGGGWNVAAYFSQNGNRPQLAAPVSQPGQPPRPVPVAVAPIPAGPRPVPVPAGPPRPMAPAPQPQAPQAQALAAQADGTDVYTAALSAVGSIIGANPNGMPRLMLRVPAFQSVEATHGAAMAQAVATTYFDNDANLSTLLGAIGYKLAGPMIAPNV